MSYLLWVWKKNVYRRAFRFVCCLEQLVYFFSFVNIVIEQKLNIIINISCKCQLGLTQVPTLQSGVQPTKSHYTLLQLTSQHGVHCIIHCYIVTSQHGVRCNTDALQLYSKKLQQPELDQTTIVQQDLCRNVQLLHAFTQRDWILNNKLNLQSTAKHMKCTFYVEKYFKTLVCGEKNEY